MQILGIIGAPEIIVIVLVVLLLFGGKKIPELMKGLGKGVKEYKNAMNGVEDEVKNMTDNNVQSKEKSQE